MSCRTHDSHLITVRTHGSVCHVEHTIVISSHALHHIYLTACTSSHAPQSIQLITRTSSHAPHHMHSIPCTSLHGSHNMRLITCTSSQASHCMHLMTCTGTHISARFLDTEWSVKHTNSGVAASAYLLFPGFNGFKRVPVHGRECQHTRLGTCEQWTAHSVLCCSTHVFCVSASMGKCVCEREEVQRGGMERVSN